MALRRETAVGQAAQLSPGELAAQAADAITALAYATMPMADGLQEPGDVVAVLVELTCVAELLPQVAQHLTDFLNAQAATGTLRIEAGHCRDGNPVAAIADAAGWLHEVEDAASRLRQAWRQTHLAIDGLHANP